MTNRRSFLKIALGTICGGGAVAKIITNGKEDVGEKTVREAGEQERRYASAKIGSKIRLYGGVRPTHTANSFFVDPDSSQVYLVSLANPWR